MTDDEEAAWAEIRCAQKLDHIRHYGPTVALKVSALEPMDGPRFAEVSGQIDTGADVTVLHLRIFGRLKPTVIRHVPFAQLGRGRDLAPQFRLRLHFKEFPVDVTAIAAGSFRGHDLVIGRDLLIASRLCIDFTTGETVLRIRRPMTGSE